MTLFLYTLIIALLSLAQELPNYSDRKFNDDLKCDIGKATLPPAHRNAVYWVKKTSDILKADISELRKNKILKAGLKAYFRLDLDSPEDLPFIQTVINHIQNLNQHADQTTYKCHIYDISMMCANPGVVGFVPPFSKNVHLCKIFFTYYLDDNYRSIALIHEWSHFWGGQQIDYLDEIYCNKYIFKSKKSVVRQPDQYAYFIYWMAHDGVGRPCRIPSVSSTSDSVFKK